MEYTEKNNLTIEKLLAASRLKQSFKIKTSTRIPKETIMVMKNIYSPGEEIVICHPDFEEELKKMISDNI